MVHIYPELAIGLAAFIAYFNRTKVARIILAMSFVLLISLNLFQTWQYNHKILPGDGITRYYYRRAFGKMELPRHELKFLFIPHMKNRDLYTATPLIEKVVNDTTDVRMPAHFDRILGVGAQKITGSISYSEGVSIVLDEETADEMSDAWLEMYADLYIEDRLFNSTRYAQFVLEAKRDGKIIFWQNLNFQIYTETEKWVNESWEFKPPVTLEAGDQINAYIWNKQSPDTIYLHKIGLNLLSK